MTIRTARCAARVIVVAMVVGACAPPASTPSPNPSESTPLGSPSSTAVPSAGVEAADVAFETLVDDLVAPIGVVTAPGDTDRAFVVEQTGRIHILRGDERATTPFLDLKDRLVRLDTEYDERGLLGLAFHPDYATNGRFFVYYSAPASAAAAGSSDHTNRLSEFRIGDDADVADAGSERVVLEFDQPQPNHSGGAFGFGPDGFLYLGTGDGGGRGDADEGHSPQGNAQDPSKLNGKVLRIDVDGDEPYAIPPDNPFVDTASRPEIFADGFRNPWRLSWEPDGDRRLLVSDVGFGRYEEIDAVVAGGNYGWRIREGAHCLDLDAPLEDLTDCPVAAADGRPLIDPIVEYSHREVGIAVVGGYVYRGTALPALRGQYVFADFSADWTTNDPDPSGSLLVADPTTAPDGPWPWRRLVVADDPLGHQFVTGMGEDAAGELIVLARRSFGPIGQTGFVYRVVPPRILRACHGQGSRSARRSAPSAHSCGRSTGPAGAARGRTRDSRARRSSRTRRATKWSSGPRAWPCRPSTPMRSTSSCRPMAGVAPISASRRTSPTPIADGSPGRGPRAWATWSRPRGRCSSRSLPVRHPRCARVRAAVAATGTR